MESDFLKKLARAVLKNERAAATTLYALIVLTGILFIISGSLVMIPGMILCIVAFFLFHLFRFKHKRIENKYNDLMEEIEGFISDLEAGALKNDYRHLSGVSAKIMELSAQLDGVQRDCDSRSERILSHIRNFSKNISDKIQFMSREEMAFDFEEDFSVAEIEEIELLSETNLALIEEKVSTLTESFNDNYNHFAKITDFISTLFEKILNIGQINQIFFTLFDNIKLVFINIQLEAIKKGRSAEEFMVIAEELKNIQESGIKNIQNLKGVTEFVGGMQEMNKVTGELKISYENLLQMINSFNVDIGELRAKVGESEEGNRELIKKYNGLKNAISEIREKWVRNLGKMKECREYAVQYVNRANTLVSEAGRINNEILRLYELIRSTE